jgi:diguanylate cyclase (GGDEF)-like protein
MKLFNPEDCLILIVDDVQLNMQFMAEILDQGGYEITCASSGITALERIEAIRPDLILLDLMMPEMDGLEVCEKLKSNPDFAELPIIFVTVSKNEEHLVKAFEMGAVDYITKPFNAQELLARVKTHLELKHSRQKLKYMLQEQQKIIKQLEELANTDSLTGLYNRRYFFYLAEQEINRAKRYQLPLSIIIIDIDKFKNINDNFGHNVGDDVLKITTKTIMSYLRSTDYCGRFGGEEFVILLPNTDQTGAKITAERIRQELAKMKMIAGGNSVSITASFGVASYSPGNDEIDTIIQQADQALYIAKRQGRNRVIAIGHD